MGEPNPSPSPKSLTLRIFNIPINITKEVFCNILEDLQAQASASKNEIKRSHPENVLYISLSPSASDIECDRYQVATVDFREIPPLLQLTDVTLERQVVLRGPDGLEFIVIVDMHFRGLTPLNRPLNPSVDIIAVTGLAGHAFGSWKSRGGREMWLRDFLPTDLFAQGCESRVFTYGYDTKLVGSTSHASLYDLSKQFLEAVMDTRRHPEAAHRPIIFIGHSLGGLLIKQALIEAESHSSDILKSCYGIFFFGVPNRGLQVASLKSMVKGQPNSPLIRDLKDQSHFLANLQQSFCRCFTFKDSKIISCYETQDTSTVQQIPGTRNWARIGPPVRMVTRESAIHTTANDSMYYEIALDGDHSTIIKFTSSSDQKYQMIRGKLFELASAAPEVISKRFVDRRKEWLIDCINKVFTEEEKTCLRSLAPNINDRSLERPQAKASSGTCKWLLNDDTFCSWRSLTSTQRLLWVSGHPGTGKTVLMTSLLAELEIDSTSVYFFCDDKLQGQRTATAILRSLLYQLLSTDSSLFNHIRKLGSLPDTLPTSWSFDMLWKAFRDIVQDTDLCSRPVYCVIDALDECEDYNDRSVRRSSLLSKITELYTSISGCKLPMIITSRPYADLYTCLKGFDTIELGGGGTKHDVFLYITQTLTQSMKSFSTEVTNRLSDYLHKNSRGMFLWVALVLEDVSNCFSEADVEQLLETIPQGLYEYYDNILGRILPKHREKAKTMLLWVVHAVRPMTLRELDDAFALSHATTVASKTGQVPSSLGTIRKYKSVDLALEIKARCGLLIEVRSTKFDWGDEYTVHLIHQSVKDFLMATTGDIGNCMNQYFFHIPEDTAHQLLGTYCLVYVAFGEFTDLYSRDKLAWRSQHPATQANGRWLHNPLQRLWGNLWGDIGDYCFTNWTQHLKLINTLSPMLQQIFLAFQTSPAERLYPRFTISPYLTDLRVELTDIQRLSYDIHTDRDPPMYQGMPKYDGMLCSLIHIAAQLGIYTLCSFLFEKEVIWWGEVDRLGSYYGYIGGDRTEQGKWLALNEAICGKYIEVVKLLIDHGLSVNWAPAGIRHSPLTTAAGIGSLEIAHFLIDHGADLGPDPTIHGAPLPRAIDTEHVEMVKLLIQAGAPLTLKANEGNTLLHYATQSGRCSMLRLLVEQGADVNCQNYRGQPPLYMIFTPTSPLLSKIPNKILIVKTLLDLGADANWSDSYGNTLLHTAIDELQLGVAMELAKVSTNLNSKDRWGRTVLDLATLSIHPHLRDSYLHDPYLRNPSMITPLYKLERRIYLGSENSQAGIYRDFEVGLELQELVTLLSSQGALLRGNYDGVPDSAGNGTTDPLDLGAIVRRRVTRYCRQAICRLEIAKGRR